MHFKFELSRGQIKQDSIKHTHFTKQLKIRNFKRKQKNKINIWVEKGCGADVAINEPIPMLAWY